MDDLTAQRIATFEQMAIDYLAFADRQEARAPGKTLTTFALAAMVGLGSMLVTSAPAKAWCWTQCRNFLGNVSCETNCV